MIGDGDLVCIATEIFDNLSWPTERTLCIDHPGGFEQIVIESAVQSFHGGAQSTDKPCAEDTAHGLDRKKKLAIIPGRRPETSLCQASAGNYAVDVRMQREVLSPGMQDAYHACFSSKMFFILGKTFHHTPGRIEEQFVNLRRFKQTQLVESFGQREHHMEISSWKQLRFSCLDPPLALNLLTLRTMTIPTRVVADPGMATVCA